MLVFYCTFVYGFYLMYVGSKSDYKNPRLFPIEDIMFGLITMIASVAGVFALMLL